MTTETLPRTAPLEPGTGTPLEPTTPIKPSEAIRLGCLTTERAHGDLFVDGKTCALGAMMVGYGYGETDVDPEYTVPLQLLPGPVPPCPDRDCTGHLYVQDMTELVTRLNDQHEWSRERIADWLEGLGL